MIRDALPAIDNMVGQFIARTSYSDRDGLRGAAFEALVVSAARFDPSRGVRFISFAKSRVWGAMFDEMRATDLYSRGARRRGEALEILPLKLELLGSIDDPSDYTANACDRIDLIAALGDLTPRQLVVVTARMRGDTLREIGEQLGVSEGRASQIEQAAYRVMARSLTRA